MAKILVVDDSEAACSLLSDLVISCGHKPLSARNGFDGLKLLRRNKDCALAFIDIHMPQMDGLNMIKEIVINEKGYYPDIPLVVVTIEDKSEPREMAKLSGVKTWCVKPIVPEQIKSIINQLVVADTVVDEEKRHT